MKSDELTEADVGVYRLYFALTFISSDTTITAKYDIILRVASKTAYSAEESLSENDKEPESLQSVSSPSTVKSAN